MLLRRSGAAAVGVVVANYAPLAQAAGLVDEVPASLSAEQQDVLRALTAAVADAGQYRIGSDGPARIVADVTAGYTRASAPGRKLLQVVLASVVSDSSPGDFVAASVQGRRDQLRAALSDSQPFRKSPLARGFFVQQALAMVAAPFAERPDRFHYFDVRI